MFAPLQATVAEAFAQATFFMGLVACQVIILVSFGEK